MKARGDQATADLFDHVRLFPVRAPQNLPRALDFNVGLAAAMAEAIRECGKDRRTLAEEMTQMLGYEDDRVVTVHALNAYTACSRESHTISVVRWLAFVRATGCVWLWDFLLKAEGLTIMQGEEALHAQASVARKRANEQIAEANQLLAEADRLEQAAPVKIKLRKRGGR